MQFFYPFMYVLPDGNLFMLIDRVSRIITPEGESKFAIHTRCGLWIAILCL
jgi:hypothetical protein